MINGNIKYLWLQKKEHEPSIQISSHQYLREFLKIVLLSYNSHLVEKGIPKKKRYYLNHEESCITF